MGAIRNYRNSIDNLESVPEAYLNLIGTLIQVNYDYGFSSSLLMDKVMTEGEISESFDYLMSLLSESNATFGGGAEGAEFVFWNYYVEDYYKSFDRTKLIRIIRINEQCIVPYFPLYVNDLMNNIAIHYSDKIHQLKEVILEKSTFKNNYIKGLVESAEKMGDFDFNT